ncbi:Protein CSF1 [Fusarium oxysporum]|uniref:Protein CSF1 n=2 Tax=Fusarium oxysporum TaxID=5507 RepID=A0A420R8G0_FUSOX|nr:Protein CSF1 [Fusarium oxysporum f. sp. cepae]RKK52644.1 Protein CSF1 [Fusarium oxysporum f. sp. cepae]RKK61877.1 Protein CSF1 [Fusarium oxysporum f. sp. cepae]RKL13301.1 Protein CSF1 [Fusarium oxysporum]
MNITMPGLNNAIVVARAAEGNPRFNYEFLIFMALCCFLAIFFVLYFNRLFASIVSYALRAYTWHHYRVYIDVKAIQISLLGGRVFFTGLRYHGENETFMIQHGYITWRYWLRRVRDADIIGTRRSKLSSGDAVPTSDAKNPELPCRIQVDLTGLEWFVYNRSPAYDGILAGLTQTYDPEARSSGISEKDETTTRSRSHKKEGGSVAGNEKETDVKQEFSERAKSMFRRTTTGLGSGEDDEQTRDDEPELPFMLRLFPVHIRCQKAAAVIGNENTKAILIAKADSLDVEVDASETTTPDPYRQTFKVQFQHPIIEIKENEDFKEDQVTRATRDRDNTQTQEAISKRSFFRHHRRKAVNSLRNLVPYWRRSVESFSTDSRTAMTTATSQVPGANQWQGLTRYLDDRDRDDRARWASVEYAAVTTILDSPEAVLTVFWDAVGKVSDQSRYGGVKTFPFSINGDVPPAWGMNFSIKGGTMNYGPWADRQRADLQRFFFPSLCKDAMPAKPLKPGDWRVATTFQLYIEMDDAVTLRVPIREESKNWRWRGKEPPMRHAKSPTKRKQRNRTKKNSKTDATEIRPAGWLEVKLPANSSVKFNMDMLASPTGYTTKLDVDLPSSELWSSVNHDLLWRSGAQIISCDLSNPLAWNSLRNWHFNIISSKMELFMLRDHIFLLTDLVDDWTAGPPADYLVFVPFKYHLNLTLNSLQLYLNVNEANIIDKATVIEDNTYLILSSPCLIAESCIPAESFRPSKNAISFDVRADQLDMALQVPQWNTQAAFLSSKQLGHIEGLAVDGSYNYNATTSSANTDTLILNFRGQSPYVYLYGFLIRYVILLKDNYFGEFVHFRTLDEYQNQLQTKQKNPDAEAVTQPPPKKSNDMDVVLGVRIEDLKVMLPTNLYSADRYIEGELASISVDLRFTNYFMEVEVEVSPISLALGCSEGTLDSPGMSSSNTQLFIDGVRLFGHKLFGLPPSEPAYVCNWDVNVGGITGECTSEFLVAVAKGGKSLAFCFDDVENALVPYSSLVFYDITFARAAVESIQVWLHVDEAAFLVSTDAIDVCFNDWARSHYSKRADIIVPNIQISCLNAESAGRQKSRYHHPVETDAHFRTTFRLAVIGRKFKFSEERRIQQELVQREDQRTHRAEFLLLPEYLDEFVPEVIDPPAQCAPPPPHPAVSLEGERDDVSRRTITSRNSRGLTHKSSFLSLAESSNGSVVLAHSQYRARSRSKQNDFLAVRPSSADNRQSLRARGSFGSHRSANDYVAKDDVAHSSVAFSSQYVSPQFPLHGLRPSTQELPFQSIEEGDDDDGFDTMSIGLDDIDPNGLGEDHPYLSVIVEFPSGMSAFVNPSALRYAASLLDALQPNEPETLLDTFQVDAMTKIFDRQKERETKGQIKDFMVRIPNASFRLLSSTTEDSPGYSQEEQDQYDLSISKVALITRLTNTWEDPFRDETRHSRTSLQLRLGSAEVSASERSPSFQEPQPAVMAQIEDVVVSIGEKDVRFIDADIGSVVGSTASGKIEYLASLIHRTSLIASDLGHIFSETMTKHENRHRLFTYLLLDQGKSTNDPSFLVRPSAVLRSAADHLRTSDSWKLAMRLRQIWTAMDSHCKSQIIQKCFHATPEIPEDAANYVLTVLEKWRGWDMGDLPSAIILTNIFGQLREADMVQGDRLPLLGACRLAELQLVLDPGPKQNKIGFIDLAARIDQQMHEAAVAGEAPGAPFTTLNISCAEAGINLNWELCELAEEVVQLYSKSQSQAQPTPIMPKPKRPAKPDPAAWPPVHVVVEVTKGAIELETINLKARTLSHGLKMSLLHQSSPNASSAMSLMLNCNAITSSIHSNSHSLAMMQLKNPSIFVSHELQNTDNTSSHTIKASAGSRNLTFAVKEDPIGLMEVLDRLLGDEIQTVYGLKNQLASLSKPKPRDAQKKIADRLSSVKFNLAMFLDEYSITIPFLQSLTYKITGTVARAAAAANFGKEIIFDFDIKENYHEMQINVRNKPRSISLLQIPPTNGRITSHMGQTEHQINILSSLEIVQLDASAVYSLLTALNRPQISSAVQELQQQTKIIQDRIAEIFGSDEGEVPKPVPESVQPEHHSLKVVYNVHLTLAGLQVFAKTSLKSEVEPIAQVLFSLNRAHLHASNRHEAHGPILKYPEIHLNLSHIGLDIRRGPEDSMRSCGNLGVGVEVSASSTLSDDGKEDWAFNFTSDDFECNLAPETISTVVDVLGYMGEKIKDLDTSRELDYLRKLRQSKPKITINGDDETEEVDIIDSVLASVQYQFELRNIRVRWSVADNVDDESSTKEDLVLSVKLFEFGTRTRRSARLSIENFQIQMVPLGQDLTIRSLHSALLPVVTFNIAYMSTASARRMAFQAVGESLDLRLTSAFIVPAAHLAESITLSLNNVAQASTQWNTAVTNEKKPDEAPKRQPQRSIFGNKRLESLLIDADFAGAVVYIASKRSLDNSAKTLGRPSPAGKYGQFNTDDSGSGTVLRSPGLAWKIEYRDDAQDDPSLYGEIKVDASSNILYPSVVPLVMDMLSSVKQVVKDDEDTEQPSEQAESKPPPNKSGDADNIITADPSAVLGRLKLNLGLRICRQEFSLSCQPIARVAATACFDNIYFTVNTVRSLEQGNFFAISGDFTKLHASVQHVYSRESTASFELDSITLSFMNSKHVSGTSGVSAIINVSPMAVSINAKQAQDFLLFREIWYPSELRSATTAPVAKMSPETSQSGHLVQRYQQVAATAAFPWTATISIAALDVTIDLGQAIGKSAFAIKKFWVSSKKTSDWEQNLCLGFDKIGVDCTGRLSGFVALQDFRLRTSIQWPKREEALNETPMIQASISFNAFRVKAAFDYQAFLVADITSLEFLMYNVRESLAGSGDRLVAIFDGDSVQIFGTTTSAAQGIALWQAVQKLVQERKESFQSSLKEIEKFMKRRSMSTSRSTIHQVEQTPKLKEEDTLSKSPISLDTDVVVTLKALNLGVFPSTFSDHQVFKVEALNAYARFAASMEQRRIHSILRMMLGQLRIGLAGVRNVEAPKTLSEISVEDVVQRATGSRGGTILNVPQVSAVMETWQKPRSNEISYIFKSAFEGKVEVGWNFSRVSYIRGMFANHAKALEQVWGKEIPLTAVKIRGVPGAEETDGEQQKITAEIDVPMSKYDYVALEPPIIETPQLRDMGEATPPLEWIGLHRDRLPNLTHQIVIVSLLELAGEVEDAYARILGSS